MFFEEPGGILPPDEYGSCDDPNCAFCANSNATKFCDACLKDVIGALDIDGIMSIYTSTLEMFDTDGEEGFTAFIKAAMPEYETDDAILREDIEMFKDRWFTIINNILMAKQ